MNKILFFFLIVAITGTSCKKIKIFPIQPETLPAETQTGRNTLGFYLNGKLWLPKSKGVDSGIHPLVSTLYGQTFTLTTYNLNQHLVVAINNVLTTGHYDLVVDNNSAQFFDGLDVYNCTEGSVDITKVDMQKFIISGIFSLKAKNSTGDAITIEQGRFDVKY